MASDNWVQLAIRMITKFGRTSAATFTRKTHGSHSTTTLTHTDTTSTTYTAVCAPIDFNTKLLEKGTIKTGEKMLYVPGVDTSGNTITPAINDTVSLEAVYVVKEILDTFETESVNCAYLLKIGR